jgi:probable HAF family extracellular repeat protein
VAVHITSLHRRAVIAAFLLLAPLHASPAGATSGGPSQSEQAVPEVTMTLLPAFDGSTEGPSMSYLRDINNQGQIVGQSIGASPGDVGGRAPALWQDGQPIELPSNNVPDAEVAEHVNERGQVLVNSWEMPYLWTEGEVTPLPVPNMNIVDLNDRGQVLVQLDGGNVALWEDGQLTPIRPPGDAPATVFARDLSEAGHVVGGVWNGGDWNGPFVWQDGTFTRLGTYGEASLVNRSGQVVSGGMLWNPDGTATRLGFDASDLNDRGQVVGSRNVNGAERAVLWEDGQLTDLGTLGGADSRATEINELGQVVGISDTPDDPWHNFLWVDGQMIDIGAAWTDSGPEDINDRGQIIGHIRRVEDGVRVGSAVLWEIHDGSGNPATP